MFQAQMPGAISAFVESDIYLKVYGSSMGVAVYLPGLNRCFGYPQGFSNGIECLVLGS